MKALKILVAVFVFVTCTSTKKEVKYELPAEMLPHVKVMYAQQCDKGYALWQKNCSGCHNKTVKRKEIIPDFKPEQLIGYALRVKNKKHEVNLPDSLVSEEDLSITMTFLSYKKKNEPERPK